MFGYIASLPQPQRGVAERIDALAATTLPDLQRAVKWGMAHYGVGRGLVFSSGAFVGNVKLMLIGGSGLISVPRMPSTFHRPLAAEFSGHATRTRPASASSTRLPVPDLMGRSDE